MFTGIILGLGTISATTPKGRGLTFSILPDFLLDDPMEGESIAVNGVCLTATTISEKEFTVDVSPETLSRTTLGELRSGSRVNLERALKLSDRLGGHIVSGHVDGVGVILERKELREFMEFSVRPPKDLMRYIIEKGSIAIDGISLTVNAVTDDTFRVAIIPHTAKITTMGYRRPGDRVNLEVDLVGKYIEKLVAPWNGSSRGNTELDMEFLRKHGFLR
ncbi:Riboflavin synthase eubacterial/eukaryotic [Dissulfuribacter thermophilus]|uniref:Riboflavin synthase n=1 Tax=Dissulfuribacter thermophilus TaxID=1156395 RepID=A0A1B9F9C1_9BACT|nr:riboflavin synthase [Dissulfuribacter thermophilus]OCC16517.1 Riboflavin synthase eubacterial/eukaryotic [Dissulfuribacter thermophilus]